MTGAWRFLKEQWARMRGSLERRSFEAEFDEEVKAHLALLSENFVRQGMTAEEARYAAQKQFGGVAQTKNELREGSRFRPFEAVLQDTAYVLRQFRRSPLFAVTAIATLALGIGVNTAVFTLVDDIILRLLPIKDPQRVVILQEQGGYYGDNMGANAMSYTMYQTIRDKNEVFGQTMCRRPMPFTATLGTETEFVSGELVSGNYFPLLGLQAAAGRVFDSNDDLRQNGSPIAVISYAYWKSRFGAGRQVIGQKLLVNNYPMTIVGIAQAGFDGLEPGLPSQIFVPVTMTPALFPRLDFVNMWNPRLRWLNVYGRLKEGMTAEGAKAGLQPLFHQMLEAEMLEAGFAHATPFDKEQFLKMWLAVLPGGQGNTVLRQRYEKPLWVLMGVTGFVLLIACANLASLLAARAVVRQREIAVRLAIGSSRGRIVQQLMTESVVLAIVGGLTGVGLAIALVKGLLTFMPENPTGYLIPSAPDWRVLLFSIGLSLLTGLLFGLIPALQAARPDVAETLKAKATSVTGSGSHISFRKLLVGAQIALSLLLLIGASLFIRSLANLRAINPGFTTDRLVQFDVNLGSIGYDARRTNDFFDRLKARLEQLPNVRAAGMATNPVLADSDWESSILVEGRDNKPEEAGTHAYINRVGRGFFEALGIHVLAGRTFRESDTADSPKVVVVSKSFERHYFGQDSAIGHRVGRGFDTSAPKNLEIVGVVNDIDYQDLKEEHARELYMCAPQGLTLGGTVYVSVKGDTRGVLASARRVVQEMEPKAPVTNMKTVERQLEESLVTERMIASLSTVFTVLAVALAILGLYGVMAYMVTQRSREIGIRMALGAVSGNVIWLVMREVVGLVVLGILVAVPLAMGLSHFVRSELYGIEPTDPLSIVSAAVLLGVVAMIAGFVPARRAALADAMKVLRYE